MLDGPGRRTRIEIKVANGAHGLSVACVALKPMAPVDAGDVVPAIAEIQWLGMMHISPEEEDVNLAIVIEVAGQGEDTLGETLHGSLLVERVHGAGNVEA